MNDDLDPRKNALNSSMDSNKINQRCIRKRKRDQIVRIDKDGKLIVELLPSQVINKNF